MGRCRRRENHGGSNCRVGPCYCFPRVSLGHATSLPPTICFLASALRSVISLVTQALKQRFQSKKSAEVCRRLSPSTTHQTEQDRRNLGETFSRPSVGKRRFDLIFPYLASVVVPGTSRVTQLATLREVDNSSHMYGNNVTHLLNSSASSGLSSRTCLGDALCLVGSRFDGGGRSINEVPPNRPRTFHFTQEIFTSVQRGEPG